MNDKQRIYSEWLVLRCQQGDRQAVQDLLALWRPRYLLYARQRLRDTDAAQDVVQDSLLGICRNVHKLDNPGSFPSWSYRIVERRCVDWLRQRVRDRRVFATGEQPPEPARSDSTAADMDVQRVLASLAPELAALLRLHYLEQLSLTEISAILDLPVGTLKSRLYYARKQIQESLDRPNTPEELP